MIQATGITKTYQSGRVAAQALRGVDLTVDRGDMVAIMGPSGSGKSTLLHILGLLERADEGSYLLSGQEVTRLGDDELADLRNRALGFVFQAFHLLPSASAVKNVMLPFVYARRPPRDAEARARAALEKVGLAHRLDHRPGELSGGERQRVAIARALVTGPELILADEPTGNLDQRSSLEVMAILQELNRAGQTVLVITHDNAVGAMCRRVVRLVYGRLESDLVNEVPVSARAELDAQPPSPAAPADPSEAAP